jgi:hypothetical protein
MPSPDDRSLLELLASLGTDVPELIRKEIELLRQEAKRALERTQGAAALLVLATAFTLATVSLLLLAGVSALASVLVASGFDLPTAVSLAALAVGIAGAIVAAVLVALAIHNLREARSSIRESVGVLQTEGAAHTETVR